MNILTNESLVRRNARIASISMLAGLLVLVGGIFVSFRLPTGENPTLQFNLSMILLLVGFTLSQVGIYFSNRWGRRPRPDQLLDQALKGLDGRYSIYHYLLPAAHVLIGPAGVWVLFPRHQRGTISFSKGRWRQRGGGLLLGYLKLFAQEGLGRPDVEIAGETEALKRYLTKVLPEGTSLPEIQAALVFTNPRTEIDIAEDENPPAEAVPLGKLKEMIRKAGKAKGMPVEKARIIQQALESE